VAMRRRYLERLQGIGSGRLNDVNVTRLHWLHGFIACSS
jgi:hypothetical protein